MKTPIHFMSGDGSSLPLALKLQTEGHPVTWHIKAPDARQMGKGYLTWADEPPKGSLVIFDTTKRGAEGAALRRRGHLVIGGNPFDEPLEIDRAFGAKVMQKAGIRIPETYPFADISSAITFLEKVDGAWFVKVSADVGECDT